MNSKQSFRNLSLTIGLKCPTAMSDSMDGYAPTSDFGMAIDFTQTITFCNLKYFLRTFTASKGIQGSEGLPPILIKNEPSSESTLVISPPTLLKNFRYSCRGKSSL